MRFKVTGHYAATGRTRARVYRARTEAEARALAVAEGLDVRGVELLAPEPPTPEQLETARSVGQCPPEGLDREAFGDWLARHQQRDKVASPALRRIAADFGLYLSDEVGKRRLFLRLFNHLNAPGRELDLVAWFAYRVYRELVKGALVAPVESPADAALVKVAEELAGVPGVVESIKRYAGEDLIWFGQWTGSAGNVHTGGSNRTKAYREAAERLRPLVASQERSAELGRRASNAARGQVESTADRAAPAQRTPEVGAQPRSRRAAQLVGAVAVFVVLVCCALGAIA